MEHFYRYERGLLTAQELETEVRAFFASAEADPSAQQDARGCGIDLCAVLSEGSTAIRVDSQGAGLTGFEEALVITIVAPVVASAWETVVLPWIRRRVDHAVGDKRDPT